MSPFQIFSCLSQSFFVFGVNYFEIEANLLPILSSSGESNMWRQYIIHYSLQLSSGFDLNYFLRACLPGWKSLKSLSNRACWSAKKRKLRAVKLRTLKLWHYSSYFYLAVFKIHCLPIALFLQLTRRCCLLSLVGCVFESLREKNKWSTYRSNTFKHIFCVALAPRNQVCR